MFLEDFLRELVSLGIAPIWRVVAVVEHVRYWVREILFVPVGFVSPIVSLIATTASPSAVISEVSIPIIIPGIGIRISKGSVLVVRIGTGSCLRSILISASIDFNGLGTVLVIIFVLIPIVIATVLLLLGLVWWLGWGAVRIVVPSPFVEPEV